MNKVKKFINAFKKAMKDEVQEIKELKITPEDEEQASKIANLAADAMMLYGIPVGGAGRVVMKKVIAYSLRDLKDGVKAPDKLIIIRVVNELKTEEKDLKVEEQ